MPRSPFSNPLFRSATFTFRVADGSTTIDERGNRKSVGRVLDVKFYVKAAGGSASRQESGLNTASSTISAYVLEVEGVTTKALPLSIKVGDVGAGMLDGRPCTAKVENVAQSSVVIVPRILGEKVQLSVTFTSKEGATG